MKTYLGVLVTAIAIVCGTTQTGFAVQVTTISYTETNSEFKWLFSWDGMIPGSGQLIFRPTVPPGPDVAAFWDPTFDIVSSLPTFLVFTAQHVCLDFCPDPEDAPEGVRFSSGVIDLVDLPPTGPVLTPVHHPGLPVNTNRPIEHDPHTDLYSLSYARAAAGAGVVFFAEGKHVPQAIGTVPEPSSGALLLTATGLIIAFRRFRRVTGRDRRRL